VTFSCRSAPFLHGILLMPSRRQHSSDERMFAPPCPSLIIGLICALHQSCQALSLVRVESPRSLDQAKAKPSGLVETKSHGEERRFGWQWPWTWIAKDRDHIPLQMEVEHFSLAFPKPLHTSLSRPSRRDLLQELYQAREPFELFTNSRALTFAGDLIWSNIGAHPEDVRFLIDLADADFIVEVGSYVGTSTKRWVEGLRNRGVPSDKRVVLSIDTWLGDLASWVLRIDNKSRPVADDVLADGRSRLYDQFMLNMISHNMTDTVVPFSVTSTVGARWLAYQNYEADLVYVDAAHEQGETELELDLYWKQVKKGGILAGDDYPGWRAVKHDVDDFVARYDLSLKFASGLTWYVIKP